MGSTAPSSAARGPTFGTRRAFAISQTICHGDAPSRDEQLLFRLFLIFVISPGCLGSPEADTFRSLRRAPRECARSSRLRKKGSEPARSALCRTKNQQFTGL